MITNPAPGQKRGGLLICVAGFAAAALLTLAAAVGTSLLHRNAAPLGSAPAPVAQR